MRPFSRFILYLQSSIYKFCQILQKKLAILRTMEMNLASILILPLLFLSMAGTLATNVALDQKILSTDRYFEALTTNHPSLSLTKLQVYLHAYFSPTESHNQTVYPVAAAEITAVSDTNFGRVIVLDNPTTAGPERDSLVLGQYQGVNAYSDFDETALTMNMNLAFTAGEYNGSTITVAGRQLVNDPVRVLSIAGGTGSFRLAQGVALASTYSIDPVTKSGTYTYVLYVVTPGAGVDMD